MYSFDKAIQLGTQNLIDCYFYKGLSLYDLQIFKESKNSLINCIKLIFKEFYPKSEITDFSTIEEEFETSNFIKKQKVIKNIH